MQIKISHFGMLFSLLGIFSVLGCATVTGSKTQPISITATCESVMVQGATCTIANDKGVVYSNTPGVVLVQKSTADLSISCVKSTYNSIPMVLQSSNNASIWGNILIGGGIGAIVDSATGSGFDYPRSANVVFSPPCENINKK